MTTSAAGLMPYGLNPQQATQLAAEIDAGASASAARLIGAGFPAPLANELKGQAVAGTGHVGKLMALGVPPALATAIKAAIDA